MDVTVWGLTSQVKIEPPPPPPKPGPDTDTPAPISVEPTSVTRLNDEVTINGSGRDDLGSSGSTGESTPVTEVIGLDSEVGPGTTDDKFVDLQPIDPINPPTKKNGKVPGAVRLLNEGHFKDKPAARLRANHAAYLASSHAPDPDVNEQTTSIDVEA